MGQLVVKPNAPPLTENSSEERACDKWFRRRIASMQQPTGRAAAEDRDVCPSLLSSQQILINLPTTKLLKTDRSFLHQQSRQTVKSESGGTANSRIDDKTNEGFGICIKISLVLLSILLLPEPRKKSKKSKNTAPAQLFFFFLLFSNNATDSTIQLHTACRKCSSSRVATPNPTGVAQHR